MADVKELKEMIIDLRMNLVKANIPSGNCPYAYYSIENPAGDCGSVSCNECKSIFLDKMRSEITEEVMQL